MRIMNLKFKYEFTIKSIFFVLSLFSCSNKKSLKMLNHLKKPIISSGDEFVVKLKDNEGEEFFQDCYYSDNYQKNYNKDIINAAAVNFENWGYGKFKLIEVTRANIYDTCFIKYKNPVNCELQESIHHLVLGYFRKYYSSNTEAKYFMNLVQFYYFPKKEKAIEFNNDYLEIGAISLYKKYENFLFLHNLSKSIKKYLLDKLISKNIEEIDVRIWLKPNIFDKKIYLFVGKKACLKKAKCEDKLIINGEVYFCGYSALRLSKIYNQNVIPYENILIVKYCPPFN